jgi:predicted metal-dependent enzyme (double-stranded beta helix superfamily)
MNSGAKWHWTDTARRGKLTAMPATLIRPAEQLTQLVAGVRTAVDRRADWPQTARLVADELRAHLPGLDVLTPEQRLGSPDGQASHTLHVEPDGAFSIIAVVWRPGLIGQGDNVLGDVSGFAPPGDIHRVHNTGDEIAISIHIYGTDVTRIGSSVRRYSS